MMKFFKKKDKKPEKINEINNKELKEYLANNALATLVQGVDYNDLAYTTVKFGYLYDFENHGIEGLFKVITDKDTFYFATQVKSIMRLDFTEELFQITVDGFLSIHEH